jgi:hypothetical protein
MALYFIPILPTRESYRRNEDESEKYNKILISVGYGTCY